MRPFLYAFCVLVFLSSCTNTSNSTKKLSHFIPDNSAIIFKTNSLETFESDLKNNDFISELSSAKLINDLKEDLKKFDSLKIKNEAIICISIDNNYSFITKLSEDFVLNDSLDKGTNYFHKTLIDSIVIASTSKDIIDAVPNKKETNTNLEKLINSTNNNSSLSVFVNAKLASSIIDSIYQNDTFKLENISDWIALDVNLQQNQILFNGVATVTDTLPKVINIFKNTIPQENKTANITPINSDGFISLTFNDFEKFNQNLVAYNSKIIDSTQLNLFKSITEIGLIYKKDDIAIALHSVDIFETKDVLLSEQNLSKTFREIDIYNFSNKDLFKSVLTPLVRDDIDKYMVLDEVVIFSNKEDLLTQIISDRQNKATLNHSDIYKNNISHLSDEASMLFVANNQNFKSTLIKNTSEKFKSHFEKLNLKNYQVSAVQFVQDNDFAHVNAIIQKNKSKVNANSISQQFNIVLDDDVLNTPQIVKNHRTNQKEIVIQDIKNNLYLISNRGKVLWKKQLNGNILGKIEQIDMYKNGRLQLAFATPKRVYVLDRNGKDVKPFPMKFKDEITQPLSVFDYDKKKKYRFLVTQGKNTLMYDTKGKTVNGFTFKKASSNIVTQPKHYRIGTKDYIVFASGNKLNILDRTGKTRINVKKDFNFSDNEIYLYRSNFSFTTANGDLKQVNQKGSVTTQNLLLPFSHHITSTSKTLVSLADNKLTIKGKSIELDFGNYTKPEIFYLRDKIYVAVTDLQSQKVYLFDSQAKPIANFPVYGTSTLQLDNLDKDRNLEFVVKGDNKSIVLYQIN